MISANEDVIQTPSCCGQGHPRAAGVDRATRNLLGAASSYFLGLQKPVASRRMKTPRGSNTADDASSSLASEASMSGADSESLAVMPFVWSQTHNLIQTTSTGAPVRQPGLLIKMN